MPRGRPRNSLNKRTITKLERQGKLTPSADAPAQPGVRQFDSLEELRTIARLQLSLAAVEQRNLREKAEGQKSDARLRELMKEATATLKAIAPYEHPQMRPLTITPDPLDLSKLTDEELRTFTRLYARAANAVGDVGDGPSGTIQ